MRHDGHCVARAMVSQAQNHPTLSMAMVNRNDQFISLRSRLCLLLRPKPATSHDLHRVDGKARQRFGIILVWCARLSREKPQTQSLRLISCSARHALSILRLQGLALCMLVFRAT